MIQRPNACNYVQLNFGAMRGYDVLKEYLQNNVVSWPPHAKLSGRIIIEQCQQYSELSNIPEIGEKWSASPYIPTSLDARGKDILNNDNYFRPMGDFDHESVMLYATDLKDNGELPFLSAVVCF